MKNKLAALLSSAVIIALSACTENPIAETKVTIETKPATESKQRVKTQQPRMYHPKKRHRRRERDKQTAVAPPAVLATSRISCSKQWCPTLP